MPRCPGNQLCAGGAKRFATLTLGCNGHCQSRSGFAHELTCCNSSNSPTVKIPRMISIFWRMDFSLLTNLRRFKAQILNVGKDSLWARVIPAELDCLEFEPSQKPPKLREALA